MTYFIDRRNQLFQTYLPMIYGALKQVGLYPSDKDYDDLVQIASLTLLEQITDLLKKDTLNLQKWQGYTYKKIHWKIIDCLRKRTTESKHCCLITDGENKDRIVILDLEEGLFIKEVKHVVETYLTLQEQQLFYDLLDPELTRRQLAKNYHISPKTLYRRQRHLKETIKKYLIWG